MNPELDILIPTYNRAMALAVTLTSLAAQTFRDFRLIISDQTEDYDAASEGVVMAVLNVLRFHAHAVEVYKHLPRRGMAEQRQFLLERARAPYALFLDDDLILEPLVVQNMMEAIWEACCGFVGSAVCGLSYIDDVRPNQQEIEFWDGPVHPETIIPNSSQWERYRLHNAANLIHVAQRLNIPLDSPRRYKVAWVGGCVLYDTRKLRSVGGFRFWKDLPPNHCGEDVLAQLRVMRRYGGCGLIPSGVYHQELPTTVPDRAINAPQVLDLRPMRSSSSSDDP